MTNKLASIIFVALMLGLAGVAPQAGAQLPLPGSLVVTVTSPASGSAVGGTITVSASVSAAGSLTTAGVRFQLDGANLGAEDTSAPYSIPWNTASSGNGTHSLTAIARDNLGNRYSSNPVTVTVSNPSPPPPPPQSRRYEETDPAVAFSAGWTDDNSSRTWSGGSAAYATTAGAQATFTFSGTSVAWIGARGPQTGIADVYLDGVFLAEVDTYSKTEEIRVPMFTANDLANTGHALTIQSTGTSNSASSGTFVVVDAFDVPAQIISRLQETDPAVTYSGGWSQGNTARAWSAGVAALSATAGAQATFVFTGTAITLIGARGPQTGIARVFLDGALAAEIDTYSPAEQIQAAVFTATGLSSASHTLTVQVTGNMNAASSSALVVVDGFDVVTPGRRYQDTDSSVALDSGWVRGNRDKAYSEGTSAESVIAGSRATFTFNGTGVRWISGEGPPTGIANVYLDGVFVKQVDTYAPTEAPQKTVFAADGLAAGPHTLTIEVTGQKNPASQYIWILVDAFDVTP
ncbi:MAG TPA: Ig-like domain-containing protein [Burkholderiales bacterium]|nr:Ig-like domain-containing protein [Burkholderiales bacterium]